MYIISWNINGIASSFKELQFLIKEHNPDFVCLQKVRNNSSREKFLIQGYRQLYSMQDCGNWSGVMIYMKSTNSGRNSVFINLPQRIPTSELSKDGHLQVYDCVDFILVNAYVPFANFSINGAVDLRKKWDVEFRQLIKGLTVMKPVVICGDLNIVHTDKDSCEPNIAQNRPCFTSWERDNFNILLNEADLADPFRTKFPDEQAATFYGNFRHLKIGNRLDYFLISKNMIPDVEVADILNDFGSGQSVPIILEFNIGSCNTTPAHS